MLSQTSPPLVTDDLQATESDVKTGHNAVNAHISQIPGLSALTALPEEKARGRRATVLETDSDYVKLAKQGGHKGLLWHEATVPSPSTTYKPSNSFFSPSEDSNQPSLITSQKKKNPGVFQGLQPPFGSDSMSTWERGASGSHIGKQKNNNAQCSQMEKSQSHNQNLELSKFRRIVHDKRPAPVDMSKLLRFGYADEDKPAAHTETSSELEDPQCSET